MSFVIGRGKKSESEGVSDEADQAGKLGTYRALDGSKGAPLEIDLDGPHAMLIVGKRGYGKSYTLGVIAEELARAKGVAPVIIDPMGVFETLAEETDGEPVPATVYNEPKVAPVTLDPRSWCALLGLSSESGAGSLVWQAATEANTIDDMCAHIEKTNAPGADKRAAINHLSLAKSWGVFDPEGLSAVDLDGGKVSIIDVSGLDDAPMNAVCRGIAESLYRGRVDGIITRLPWLMIDEAHTFFDGIAQPALNTILTRGRAPGVSLVSATQRPSAVPPVAISQSDILISHRLTSQADLEALNHAQPTYMNSTIDERMPTDPGEVIVIDDATETTHAAQIRSRSTPHGGSSPCASNVLVRN